MRLSFALMAFACVAASAGAACASPNDSDGRESVTVRITVKSADLSTATGVQTLYRRIKDAADRACTNEADYGLAVLSRDDACVDQAVSGAVRRLNIPALSRLDDRNDARHTSDVALGDDPHSGR
jgi:UrcA family protein